MKTKPNIILITTDQQRVDSLGCYGFNMASTPNIDRLAKDGVLFERAYCTNPVCTPSRASLYSGRYVGNHGAWNVGTKIPRDEPLLSHRLSTAGYRTHHIGKAHFEPYFTKPELSRESTQPGWESNFEDFNGSYYGFETVELAMGHSLYGLRGHYGQWVKERTGELEFPVECISSSKFGGEAYVWDIPAQCHSSYWTASRAIAFMNQSVREDERPFFLSLGFQDPHHPHALPRDKAKDIQADRMSLPIFSQGELDDKPQHFRDVHQGNWNRAHDMHGQFPMAGQSDDGTDYRGVTDNDARLGKAYYYGMVELVDEAIGQILSSLDDLELMNDTIIVFTSDHGELLGDHGIWMKGPFHYEALINVPLIMQWKGHFKEGEQRQSLISLVDVAPTLLSLCGIDNIDHHMDGLDQSVLLLDDDHVIRKHALIECVDDPDKLRLKTLVTQRYKITVYYGEYGLGYGELYDLLIDPNEIRNLWNLPEEAELKNQMLIQLVHELESLDYRAQRICYA